ncbi:MAG: AAA family ATPase [Puniceicoccales bacterium]|jgi:predicted ATPase|nr:AAA family ATPase [Puniceicoccales bacterium]
MLSRLYANNFRTFVNFEVKFDRLNLLLGPNGSGKSSVFDLLRKLRAFIGGEAQLSEVFPASELTNWQTTKQQKFELELQTNDGVFLYTLILGFSDNLTKSKIEEERLELDKTILFLSNDGEAHLYGDNGKEDAVLTFDWTRSGVGFLQTRRDNTKLTTFKRHIENFLIVRPTPSLMKSESQQEEKHLALQTENFAAWYRYLTQENLSAVQEIFSELPKSLPG